jgi:uncharacterized membrane protein
MEALIVTRFHASHEHTDAAHHTGTVALPVDCARSTMSRAVQAAALAGMLGCGLVAGVCFAFSAFVMPALDRLPAAQSIAAMQSLNKVAVTPAFMLAFLGSAIVCAGLAIQAITARAEGPAAWALAGSLVFLLGVIVVSFAANIPLNDSLDGVDAHAADAAARWSDYYASWMPWNHVRAVTGITASGLLAIALKLG